MARGSHIPRRCEDRSLIKAIASVALAMCVAADGAADSVLVSSGGGYARFLFTLDAGGPRDDVGHGRRGHDQLRPQGRDRSRSAGARVVHIRLAARGDADGKSFHLALAQRVRVHSSAVGDRVAIDLAPARLAATPPDLPQPPPKVAAPVDPASLATVKVRAGAYQNFTRLVFDWPKEVPYSVFPGAGKLTVKFNTLARPDFTALLRQAPPWVKNAAWHIDGKAIVVEFETDQASGFHDFRDGPRGDRRACAQDRRGCVCAARWCESEDHPAHREDRRHHRAGPSRRGRRREAQRHAAAGRFADSCCYTCTAKDRTGRACSCHAGTPTTQPAPTAAPPPPADPNAAQGKLTRDGAVMTFAGASRRGSAVFLRGMTAWIVLQDAPPLDAAKLKAQLGTFPDTVEASSGGGIAILRIALKEPEQIAAFADGSNLKVVIAPQVTPNATAIGFARNQDDATHSSMSTLLPGATRTVNLVDPVAGDALVLVPAAAGRAMMDERSTVEFQALQTASGLVLVPSSTISPSLSTPRA